MLSSPFSTPPLTPAPRGVEMHRLRRRVYVTRSQAARFTCGCTRMPKAAAFADISRPVRQRSRAMMAIAYRDDKTKELTPLAMPLSEPPMGFLPAAYSQQKSVRSPVPWPRFYLRDSPTTGPLLAWRLQARAVVSLPTYFNDAISRQKESLRCFSMPRRYAPD